MNKYIVHLRQKVYITQHLYIKNEDSDNILKVVYDFPFNSPLNLYIYPVRQ